MHKIGMVVMFLVSLASGPVLALAQISRPDHGLMPVRVAPWANVAETALAVGGRMIGPQKFSCAGLVYNDAAGFAGSLSKNGAWLVPDADTLSILCGA